MNKIITAALAIISLSSCAIQKPALEPIANPSTPKTIAPSSLVEVVDFQKEFLKRINKARTEGCKCGKVYMPPVEPLIWNTQLELSALGHAQDMARNKYFSHVSKTGARIKDRITGAGYTYAGFQSFTIGENIALNQRSIREVMNGWLKSPEHCKNIMSPAFKEVGVAMQDYYWVQNFGGRVTFSRKSR
jgi:uncharacterized protein YkwD